MLHPFSGVSGTCDRDQETHPSRRQALGTMVFAAGAVAVPALAHGQIAITNAVNEAGAPRVTTLALGEEGAATRALNEAGGRTLPAATTEPFGEEAGKVMSHFQPGLEDGGVAVKPPIKQPVTEAIPEEGRATTLAIGEEGGRKPINPATDAINEQGGQKPVPQPQATTLAIGEEGAAAPGQAGQAVAQVAIAAAVVQAASTEAVGEEGAQVPGNPGQPVQKVQIRIQGGPIQIQVQPAITTQALNEEAATGALREGGISTRAVNEEGGLTKALNDAGINVGRVILVKPMSRDLTDAQLKAVWADLGGSDANAALQASAVLYGSKQVLTFLKGHLKLEQPKADPAQVAKRIKDLDSDDFETRENAEKALEKLGGAAVTALQAALNNPEASTEVKMRAARLLEKAKVNSPILQAQRGVEVLVALATPEAKELLKTLANGPDNDLVVPVARKALERMK